MSFVRARVLRSLQSSLRHSGARATPRVSAPTRTQLAVGRRYASGDSHGHHASSELPWLIAAIGATVSGCWYLWPEPHTDGGHHGGHGAHGEKHEEAHEEKKESAEEKPAQESGDKEEGEPSGSADESQSKGSDNDEKSDGGESEEGGDKKEGGEDEKGGDKKEGAQFKGQMKEDSDGQSDTRKSESDGKGASKKRIDSGLQKDSGSEANKEYPDGKETPSPSKSPNKGGDGSMAAKQAGLSNTPTRHSTDVGNEPEQSKKSEGGPESAKAVGTIDPKRPQSS